MMGGGFYVSVIDGPRAVLALGPFQDHQRAKSEVERVRRYVVEHDAKGWFYLYGTARCTDGRPGRLNGVLGMTAQPWEGVDDATLRTLTEGLRQIVATPEAIADVFDRRAREERAARHRDAVGSLAEAEAEMARRGLA